MSKQIPTSAQPAGTCPSAFRSFADAASCPMWVAGANGEWIHFNRAWIRFTGQSPESTARHGLVASADPHDGNRVQDVFDRILREKEPYTFEYRLRRVDGSFRWVQATGAPILDPNGELLGYLGSCIDIHESKASEDSHLALQRQLVQAQKMESLGQFSVRIAHDLNNVLSVIRGHLQLLERVREDHDRFHQSASMALVGCEQGSQLIQDLLRFGSPATSERKCTDARSFVQHAIDFVRNLIDKNITFHLGAGGDRDQILIDVNQMQQVFTNLFINAQHAMNGSGNIHVSFAHRTVTAEQSSNELAPGSYVEIAVLDDGPGIPAENLSRVFEPFYTTKSVGIGTGLGLAVAYTIVKNHGGWIEASSPRDGGAKLSVILPLA
ncbi:MAG: PAS domain S-box protein [Deltaproteobacteria bacterium]|nr:PAS domain S-box protein [Deltaproteobacteria bacterium]